MKNSDENGGAGAPGPGPLTLGEFEPASLADWRARVERDLKGAPFDKRLVSELVDGFALQPVYTSGKATSIDRSARGWAISARVVDADPKRAAESAQTERAGGADSVRFVADSTLARGGSPADLKLDGVAALGPRDWTSLIEASGPGHVALDAGAATARLGLALVGSARTEAMRLEVDPIGHLASTGLLPQGIETAWDEAAELTKAVTGRRELHALSVSDSAFHAGGGSESASLGWGLGCAVSTLRALDARGVAPADTASLMSFRVSLGADFLLGVAKLRALRQLWTQVMQGCGVAEPKPLHVVAELGTRALSIRDPWVNILRGTTACFAAGVGGADVFELAPFDARLGSASPLARRVARNTSLVLRDEAHLGAVTDPASGAWALESMTADVARIAWAVMQQAEKAGGVVAALVDDKLQHLVDSLWSRKKARLRKRRDAVVGVSAFPNLTEVLPTPVDHAEEDAHLKRQSAPADAITWPSGTPTRCQELEPRHLSAPFEALRDDADIAKPSALLVTLGPVAEHNARTMWVTNTLAAGGIALVTPEGDTAPADALRANQLRVAVVSGATKRYVSELEPLVASLRSAGATSVVVAGRPGDHEDAWRKAGATRFLYVGQDIAMSLEVIQRTAIVRRHA